MRQALILAGGLGTRLQERLAGLPKPLADVGGTPLLGHQLELLARHGFAEAVVLVNHAADRIRDYLSSWSNPGLRVECVDDGQPKGTAGAVRPEPFVPDEPDEGFRSVDTEPAILPENPPRVTGAFALRKTDQSFQHVFPPLSRAPGLTRPVSLTHTRLLMNPRAAETSSEVPLALHRGRPLSADLPVRV